MIAGLPWESWLLLAVAVGLGLTIELLFYRARRSARRAEEREPGSGVGEAGIGAAGDADGPEDGP